MSKIKKMYVVHHSHTDIGYTDLQERILYAQANYIRTVLNYMKKPENEDFRWNCETYFCVEQFLQSASKAEKEEFFERVKENRIGISATYLNFTDLLDTEVYRARLREMLSIFEKKEIRVKTAMIADINGISMGQRDVMIENGIEFLYTNIHCHHGMYPLYQNQTPYYWENASGKRLLVWNGEHYNLGNALGIKPNTCHTYMGDMYFGKDKDLSDEVAILHDNLTAYIHLCEDNGYKYNFIIASVSGVFSDNAPPSEKILRIIEEYNSLYGDEVELQMISLSELYDEIREEVEDVPVYRGDLTDWWANGVGSTPYAVKHYKEAVRLYHMCERLEEAVDKKYPVERKAAQDNLLLYAEHTWGHSATITNPYDTMVLNLDMRKNSYASKAHESSALLLTKIQEKLGDTLRYYNTSGTIKTVNTTTQSKMMPVEFYIETLQLENVRLTNAVTGEKLECQISEHPRGKQITFCDSFLPKETKIYRYEELPVEKATLNSRVVYRGSEGIHDIINTYDPMSYRLPYEFENDWFYLSYANGSGIKEFIDKKTGKSMLAESGVPFFTPISEVTEIRTNVYEERRRLGRNIRGQHAAVHIGKLRQIECTERGKVFTTLAFDYELFGASHARVIVKFYERIPRVDYKLQLAKNNSRDIESIYMPMTVALKDAQVYLKKGEEPFRPGIDQIPGTCMEYYISDSGAAFIGKEKSAIINSLDVPLIAMGELKHHPIRLCDGKAENNQRLLHSWIMNNTWETNFKMDLGGYSEFCYILSLTETTNLSEVMEEIKEQEYGAMTLMME